jgi:hypothetical protein
MQGIIAQEFCEWTRFTYTYLERTGYECISTLLNPEQMVGKRPRIEANVGDFPTSIHAGCRGAKTSVSCEFTSGPAIRRCFVRRVMYKPFRNSMGSR